MKRISSRMTFLVKWILPWSWLGTGLSLIVINWIGSGADTDLTHWMFVTGISLAGFAFLVITSRSLMDEVTDHGGHLVIRNGRQEERIPIGTIVNVNIAPLQSYSRITLRLDRPCRFGREIGFMPAGKLAWNPLVNEVADDLIARSDRARRVIANR